jgi:hypothetical protein
LHSLSLTLSVPRLSGQSSRLELNPTSGGRGKVDVSKAALSRVPSSARVLIIGWLCCRRAVSQRNPTLATHRSACDGIHGSGLYGSGLPTSVCSSLTAREGSVTSTSADRASPVTLRRRRIDSSSSGSKNQTPSFYSLRVRVRGQLWL